MPHDLEGFQGMHSMPAEQARRFLRSHDFHEPAERVEDDPEFWYHGSNAFVAEVTSTKLFFYSGDMRGYAEAMALRSRKPAFPTMVRERLHRRGGNPNFRRK